MGGFPGFSSYNLQLTSSKIVSTMFFSQESAMNKEENPAGADPVLRIDPSATPAQAAWALREQARMLESASGRMAERDAKADEPHQPCFTSAEMQRHRTRPSCAPISRCRKPSGSSTI